jgi:hypothetical protein
MTESKDKLAVKGAGKTPNELGNTCEFCSDTFTTKKGLATHERQCPDNPKNTTEPEIQPVVRKQDDGDLDILASLDLPPEVREYIDKNPIELESIAQQLSTELKSVIAAVRTKQSIKATEEQKERAKLKEIGYKSKPVVMGNFKRVILVSLDGILGCLDRESKGWSRIDGLCAVAPNGAVYMHFEKK